MIQIGKTVMGRPFNPDRYGMIYCPVCKGSGKIINGLAGRVVCKVCGGFGLIKKQETGFEETGMNWNLKVILRRLQGEF